MLFSQIELSDALELSHKEKEKIVFGEYEEVPPADFAILLGGSPHVLEERALGAAKLYNEGKVKYVIPSGGVEWDFREGRTTEALRMATLLERAGVPREAILVENQAQTTVENMIFGFLQISRKGNIYRAKDGFSAIIITSPWHVKRSLVLAKLTLPPLVKVYGYGVKPDFGPGEWHKYDHGVNHINSEIKLLKCLVDHGLAEDIEF